MTSQRIFRRLAPYVVAEWPLLVGTAVTMLTVSVASLAKPWPLQIVIDNVLGSRPAPAWLAGVAGGDKQTLLLVAVGLMIAATALAQGLALLQTYLSQLLGQRLVLDLRCDLYAKLQHLSLRFHDHRNVGDLIYRITGDSEALQNIVTFGLVPIVIQTVTVISVGAAIFLLDPSLALVSLAALPFLVLNTVWFSSRVRNRSRGLAMAESGLYSKVSEALGAIRAVKAHGAEARELSTFTDRARETQKAYVRVATLSTLGGLVNELIAGLSTAAVVLVVALIALRGGITVGELLVFMAYLAALQAPITTLAQSALVVQRSRSSAERVVEILDEVEDERTTGGRQRVAEVKGALTFEQVDFRYVAPDGTSRGAAITAVDLHIRPGEMVALVGRSGAGKSTLLSLLMGFYRPQSGRILVDGLDIREAELGWLRGQVALVLQEPIIFSATLAENIGYARPGAHRGEIEAAAKAANLHDFILTLPDGYDTEVGERGSRLSGGQKQRIGIARAFLKDAPILILDEPTSNLDAQTERHVFEALHRLAKGRTTLLVAHRLATAQRADRIVVMEEGRVVEQGTHAELIESQGRYFGFWADQHARSEAPATVD